MCVAIDRNTENGVEIQHSACGRSWIRMRPRIMKSVKNEKYQQDERDNLPHGTKVPKEIVMPWANTDRIVCPDS